MLARVDGRGLAWGAGLFVMARLPVPIVVVIIGEGASGGALGIGVGDRILMLENAWYSVISPESCSSILWRNWDHKEDAARALRLTAPDLLEQRVIDEILPEPIGGAHRDPAVTFDTVGRAIARHLAEMDGTPPDRLLDAIVFSSPGRPWRDVMVAGRWVVRDHLHPAAAAVAGRFEAAMAALWGG